MKLLNKIGLDLCIGHLTTSKLPLFLDSRAILKRNKKKKCYHTQYSNQQLRSSNILAFLLLRQFHYYLRCDPYKKNLEFKYEVWGLPLKAMIIKTVNEKFSAKVPPKFINIHVCVKLWTSWVIEYKRGFKSVLDVKNWMLEATR